MGKKPIRLLSDNIDRILNGTAEEKAALAMHYYKVADTPNFIYTDKKMAAEKLSFLTQRNPAQYTASGGLSNESDTLNIPRMLEMSMEEIK